MSSQPATQSTFDSSQNPGSPGQLSQMSNMYNTNIHAIHAAAPMSQSQPRLPAPPGLGPPQPAAMTQSQSQMYNVNMQPTGPPSSAPASGMHGSGPASNVTSEGDFGMLGNYAPAVHTGMHAQLPGQFENMQHPPSVMWNSNVPGVGFVPGMLTPQHGPQGMMNMYVDMNTLRTFEERMRNFMSSQIMEMQREHHNELAAIKKLLEDSMIANQQAQIVPPAEGPLTKKGRKAQNTQLEAAVHEKCLYLLGDPPKRRKDDADPGGKPYYDLPEPLVLGDTPRFADDPERTKLHNPHWLSPASHPVNAAYIDAATDLLYQERVNETDVASIRLAMKRRLKQAVKKYFESLRSQYKARVSEEARTKREGKMRDDRQNMRKHRKCDAMRISARKLKKIVGRENVHGLKELLHTDWMSSEDTADEGANLTRMVKPLKVRQLGWRSPSLNRIYARLQFLMAIDLSLASESEPEDNTHIGVSTSTVFTHYRRRFRGPADEADEREPPIEAGQATIWRECVSTRWAEQTPGGEELRDALSTHPENFTIFDLEIPDCDLSPQDLAWLADGEESDDDEAE
ncbi:hypothetical protein CERSUDRAFT_91614 [Gelatoporia subvermispora B]|uniref:Uncharacterized protein n=1 Tax=Ceriporiopsis subvermispora (strain B) TaxID=914234 RepID=M2PVR5_CERS8|nr:hypothetical protein CERSUDRAFT_91614 [Gelatoporia subvermispora B]